MNNIQVSKHGTKRIRERCGVNKKSARRMCSLAASRGVERENTKGRLRKWLDSKYSDGYQIYAYGDKAFLFSKEEVLITVLQIPSELTRNMSRMFIAQPA